MTQTSATDQRAIARRLDAERPGWTIWWGPATGHFWAMPARGAAVPLIERARPDELVAAMREVEAWHDWPGSGGRAAKARLNRPDKADAWPSDVPAVRHHRREFP
ncbi:hypothetical protein [Actinomadura hibisca]|uniref:hypothetical protein n=1 Tax=Actinomadura hibisca TaxID=68565 RepID=UPI00082F0698|nr:hypothetical protein [Actinomadura hibisca]